MLPDQHRYIPGIIATAVTALVLLYGFFSTVPALAADPLKNATEEEIWQLEEAYFTNLYRADYANVLAHVHPGFLGWPANLPKPINRDESAGFMRLLIPSPTACAIRVERAGLQQSNETVLTQYTLHVLCPEAAGMPKSQSSRISHTWARQQGQWLLLGGMSVDIPPN